MYRYLAILLALSILPSSNADASYAVLEWTPPAFNTDGSLLTDLTSYEIWHGCNQPGVYGTVEVILAPANSHTVLNLPNVGTCYFAAKATNSKGQASNFSNTAEKFMGSLSVPPDSDSINVIWSGTLMGSPVVEAFTGPTFENDVSDNTLTLTVPAGTVEGDLLIAQFGLDSSSLRQPTDDDSAAGWNRFVSQMNDNAVGLALYWLIAPASPPATYSFTKIDTGGSVMGGGMLRISGADTIAPIDVSGGAQGVTDATTDCPDVLTTVVDTLVLRFFAADDDDYPSADSGYPTDHTGLYADQTTLGNDMSVGAAWINQAAIAQTGIGRFTGVTPIEQWAAITVAIAPAAAGVDLIEPPLMHSFAVTRATNY